MISSITTQSGCLQVNLQEAIGRVNERLALLAGNLEIPPSTDKGNASLLLNNDEETFQPSKAIPGNAIALSISEANGIGVSPASYVCASAESAECIQLNGSWLETASTVEIETVLMEELDHALAARIVNLTSPIDSSLNPLPIPVSNGTRSPKTAQAMRTDSLDGDNPTLRASSSFPTEARLSPYQLYAPSGQAIIHSQNQIIELLSTPTTNNDIDSLKPSAKPSSISIQTVIAPVKQPALTADGANHEVMFLSSDVDDAPTLIGALRPDIQQVLLDASKDGLEQIASWLSEHNGITAVHIVSHGRPGSVELGNLWLDSNNIAIHGDKLARIGQALAPGGDLLLYGCNLAAGEAGVAFLDQLSQATGVDVAASDDLTGAASAGGDWVLEAQRGGVQTSTAFLPPALGSYVVLLAVSDQNFDGELQNVWTTATSQTVGTWTFSGLGGTAMDFAIINADDFGQAQLADNNGDLSFLWNVGINNVTNTGSFAFRSADGTNFDLNSFSLGSADGGSMSVTVLGWRDNAQVVSGEVVDLTTSDSAGNITYTLGGTTDGVGSHGLLTFGSAFDNVDEIRLVFSATSTVEIDDINISPAFVKPTLNVTVASTALRVGQTSGVTFTFSEAVTGFTNADLTIANGTLSNVSSSDGGVTWTATYTPTAGVTDTTNVISVDMTGVTSMATSNAGSGPTNSNNFTIDTQRPTATISLNDTALRVGDTSVVTFTFSEVVTGFSNADLTIANGTLGSVSSSDGGTTWTATFTPSNGVTGASNVITLDNTGVTDAAGNVGSGTTNSGNYAIDTVRPALASAITISDTDLRIGDTATVTFSFSEAVTGFTIADLNAPNATLSSLSSSNGGITWTATLTPSASTTATSNIITLDYTGIADAAGNAGLSTATTGNYAVDTVRPTGTILVADNLLTLGETSLVTFTFSEAVTGFTNADLTLSNGTLSSVSSSDGGITWTATLTPTNSVTDATNLINVAMSGVTDFADNTGSGSTDSNNYAISMVTIQPTAGVTVAEMALCIGETSLVTFTFSEAVTGFTNADLTIANGTISDVSSSDGGVTWTATFTPSASVTDATNVITLDMSGVTSISGSITGIGTQNSNNYAIDMVRPSLASAITISDTALCIGDNATVTITFTEVVNGFTIADFITPSASLSNLSSGDGGITWTATLTPSGSTTDSTNIITLDYSGITDTAGNAGSASITSGNYSVDSAAPYVLAMRSTTANGTYGVGKTITIEVQFTDGLVLTGSPRLRLETGSIDQFATFTGLSTTAITNDTLTFTYTVQIGDSSADLDQSSPNALELGGAILRDAAGNDAVITLATPGSAGSLSDNAQLVVDGVPPTGSLGSYATTPAYRAPSTNPFGITNVGGGGYANPTLADIDADGDLDLFIGNLDGNTLLFTNTASLGATAPAYSAATTNPFGITNVGQCPSLTFGDIDADGDLDLFIGNHGSDTLLFRNTASSGATAPAYSAPSTNPFGITFVGYRVNPSLVDIDDDGDLDLIIGEMDGNTLLFTNTASAGATAPAYSAATTNPFDITDVGSFASPTFADIDGDGDLDLFIGNGYGNTLLFTNTASPGATVPAYSTATTNPFGITDVSYYANPTVADIDGDGDLDLFIGNHYGDTLLFTNTAATPVAPVTATTPNGSYGIGSVITITIGFSEAVLVDITGGTPRMQLETGSTDRYATYSSGTGSNTLFFEYTVQAGDTSADLDQLSSSALTLNGGTIKDAAGNNALLELAEPGSTGSLASNAQIIIDTRGPAGTLALPGGYPAAFAAPSGSPFGITDIGDDASPVFTDIDGDGDLDLFIGNSYGNTVYFKNTAAPGSTAPAYEYVTTNPFGITNVDYNASPVLTDIDGDGDLDLFIGNRDGNTLFFQNTAVTYVAPVTSTKPNGTYGVGDTISVEVQFTKGLVLTGSPRLRLETGSIDRFATFTGLSTTSITNDTLTFTYTVQIGDSSADLDQSSPNALDLNGGTLKDAAGTDAILTLALPGSSGSLAANGTLTINTSTNNTSLGQNGADPDYERGKDINGDNIMDDLQSAVTTFASPHGPSSLALKTVVLNQHTAPNNSGSVVANTLLFFDKLTGDSNAINGLQLSVSTTNPGTTNSVASASDLINFTVTPTVTTTGDVRGLDVAQIRNNAIAVFQSTIQEIDIYFPENTSASGGSWNALYKTRKAQNNSIEYYLFDYDPLTGLGGMLLDRDGNRSIDGARLYLKDGELGDFDEDVNGRIDDPIGFTTLSKPPTLEISGDGKGLTVDGVEGTGLWISLTVSSFSSSSQSNLEMYNNGQPIGAIGATLGSGPTGSQVIYLAAGSTLSFRSSDGAGNSSNNPALSIASTPTGYSLGLDADRNGSYTDLMLDISSSIAASSPASLAIARKQLESSDAILDLTSIAATGITLTLDISTDCGLRNRFGFVKLDPLTGTTYQVNGVSQNDGAAFRNAILSQFVDPYQGSSTSHRHGQSRQSISWALDSSAAGYYAPVMITQGGEVLTFGASTASDGRQHVKLLGTNTFGFEDLLASQGSDWDFNDTKIRVSVA